MTDTAELTTCRTPFEAWARAEGFVTERYQDGYRERYIDDMWRGWMAAVEHSRAQSDDIQPIAWLVVDATGKRLTIYNPQLADALRRTATEVGSTLSVTDLCERAPKGWICSREPNHDGPCAAHDNHPYRAQDAEPTIRNDRIVEDARDAARYRLLRAHAGARGDEFHEGPGGTLIVGYAGDEDCCGSGAELDRMCDAALSAQRGEATCKDHLQVGAESGEASNG